MVSILCLNLNINFPLTTTQFRGMPGTPRRPGGAAARRGGGVEGLHRRGGRRQQRRPGPAVPQPTVPQN